MRDIVQVLNNLDLNVDDSIVPKGANLLSVQIGALEYSKEFGIDLKFFLDNTIVFQTESFKSYLVQRLSQNFINVTELINVVDNLVLDLNFSLDQQQETTGFVL